MADKPKCRVFFRIISPEGYTVDVLAECEVIELEGTFSHFPSPPYHTKTKHRLKLLPDISVLAYRITEGTAKDQHLIGDQLPEPEEFWK